MNKLIQLCTVVIFILMVSCSGPADPQSQLKKIDELMNQGFPISASQMTDIEKFVADGKGLLAQGKEKEASELLAKAVDILNIALDADIFNKAD